MALNCTGPIAIGGCTSGVSIAKELGLTTTAQHSLNCTSYRTLSGQSSGAVSMNAFHGKSNSTSVTYLVIAGGGGGGVYYGGGGGAGGFRTGTIAISGTNTVTVGSGGVGWCTAPRVPTKGGDSVFSSITSSGGGTGAYNNPTVTAATSGGSGGGGNGIGCTITGASGNTPSTSPAQGNNGANGVTGCSGGGGGGAGAAGSGRNGGSGASSSITGSSVTYAGGGGAYSGSGRGCGGSGGGGNAGASGTANSGGGGGGYIGGTGNGGSGIVIISAPKTAKSTTGSPCVSTSGCNTIYTFKSSGSITF